MSKMDQTMRDKLSQLVEELTTSGEPQLNQDKMKEVKKICKVSTDYVDHFYHLIMTQLNQEHGEIRLSAFQMVSEIFSRSHHFRDLLITNFQEFLELTVETDTEQLLPPPKEVARKLRTLAIQTVQSWHATYGEAYKKLSLGYHFLKQIKKVDFHDVEARTLAERKRQEEKQKRLERIYKEKLEKAKEEMEETTTEIEETLTEMNNCIKLLATDDLNLFNEEAAVAKTSVGAENISDQPCCSKDLSNEQNGKMTEKKNDEGQTDKSSDESDTEEVPDEDAFLRSTGLMSYRYQLELNVSTDLKLRETEENEVLVNTVRDLHRLITTRHLPLVQSWIQVFTKVGVEEELMRRATELKKSLEYALRKHEFLHIDYKNRERRVMRAPEDGEDDDDDFVDVPEKEGYEPHIPEHLRAEYGLDETPSTSTDGAKAKPSKPVVKHPVPLVSSSLSRLKRKMHDEEQDPTCVAATLRVLKQRLYSTPSTSMSGGSTEFAVSSSDQRGINKDKASVKAPVIPFGVDLYYWGEEQPTAGKIIKNASQHQFWVPHEVEEEVENEELSAEMKSRYITFAGKFKPVEHKCNAPMPNGSLCERQDRVKCPFHGHIIPRDELGRPVNPEDALRLEKEKRKREEEQPDWRDPELMREIEAVTGEDLGSSKTYGKGRNGNKGKSKKKYPNLTDLKQNASTSRSRLEKKVFNKSSMRRVTEVMNKMDKRKHEKFSNQFNYALN
ncbi:UV-stimulated scaffold protein A [Sinocyclocheilus anshuiensis]|uniref:UV-stimulated scaffold protein A n=1 Tax=Sinocyclocheilus anshuiensis TaxID=1608454 RepID=A0A671SHV0_9TELE|nr:PREDICTED: UV-stimulated scaffold protein A [Sinocyclocheilus anshuiensis]XP_016330052.1 PREDICTED: UV-stimulated scaffold protein A [Sinocyclocheilus anshuiensis]